MQIEVYHLITNDNNVTIELEAICDSFSSLLWDVEYYECGQFEIYIAATEQNLEIFQTGKIVGRDDDKLHFGIIEAVQLETDAENGDYLTVTGRFLMSILSRRIIYPTLNFTKLTTYGEILQMAVQKNCLQNDNRKIPGLSLGEVSGDCWSKTAKLQVSYDNLMDWIYEICKLTGGTVNIRLQETTAGSNLYRMQFELSQGDDRSILQDENPHIVFSDSYNNLLSFSYALNRTKFYNFAYIFGSGEGADRKRTTLFSDNEPQYLERYEVYVDAKDISEEEQDESGQTVQISDADYMELLQEKGAEKLVPITETTESTIATDGRQYQYNRDYFLGDFVTILHSRFGLSQEKMQLVGMIESFDQNGYSLTPTFEKE